MVLLLQKNRKTPIKLDSNGYELHSTPFKQINTCVGLRELLKFFREIMWNHYLTFLQY